MSRHWKESLDPTRHRDYMRGFQDAGGIPIEAPRNNLIVKQVYFVEVAGFTFQFASLDQVREALDYCRQKTHPGTRQPEVTLEHYWQRWHERLPKGLLRGTKRGRVVKALEKAIVDFTDDA